MPKLNGDQLSLLDSIPIPIDSKVSFGLPGVECLVEGVVVEGFAQGPEGMVPCNPIGTVRVFYELEGNSGEAQLPISKVKLIASKQQT